MAFSSQHSGIQLNYKYRTTVRLMVSYRLPIVTVLALTYVFVHVMVSNDYFGREKHDDSMTRLEFTSIELRDSFVRDDDRIEAIRNLLVEYDDQQHTKVPRRRFRRLPSTPSIPELKIKSKSILKTLMTRNKLKAIHVDRASRLKFDHRNWTYQAYRLKNSTNRSSKPAPLMAKLGRTRFIWNGSRIGMVF